MVLYIIVCVVGMLISMYSVLNKKLSLIEMDIFLTIGVILIAFGAMSISVQIVIDSIKMIEGKI